jgi:hypothetical protein
MNQRTIIRGALAGLALLYTSNLFASFGPQWWYTRGVISSSSTPDDYAIANQGQLKNIATAATAELDSQFAASGGAGATIHNLINSWSTPGQSTRDYSPVTEGQLKAVSSVFYSRLLSGGVSVRQQLINFGFPASWNFDSPWDPSTDQFTGSVKNYAPVNVAQLKVAFSFDFPRTTTAIRSGFTANTLPANDDGSTGLVSIGFPITLFGQNYTQCYVNNNGNITFDRPLSQYTPGPFQNLGFPIIAAFWGDVDTRASGSQVVTYSYGSSVVNGRSAFGINYINVGYYNTHADKLNSFQLILIDRSDTGSGNFDIEFDYGKVQWETGDASGGQNGYGGSPARVGITNGSNRTLEIAHSGETLALLDASPSTGRPNYSSGLIYQALNSDVPGRLVFPVRGGNLIGALQVEAGSDQSISLSQGSTNLSGSASDPAGNGISTTWTQISGPSNGATFSDAQSLTPAVTFTQSGTYVFQLTVRSVLDNTITAADSVTVTVN